MGYVRVRPKRSTRASCAASGEACWKQPRPPANRTALRRITEVDSKTLARSRHLALQRGSQRDRLPGRLQLETEDRHQGGQSCWPKNAAIFGPSKGESTHPARLGRARRPAHRRSREPACAAADLLDDGRPDPGSAERSLASSATSKWGAIRGLKLEDRTSPAQNADMVSLAYAAEEPGRRREALQEKAAAPRERSNPRAPGAFA